MGSQLNKLTVTQPIVLGLDAVIVAVAEDAPRLLIVRRTDHALTDDAKPWASLPFGPFEPDRHRTLEIGMRSWVAEQTGLPLGHVEQLYTFGDRYRDARELVGGPRVVTVGYLALTHFGELAGSGLAGWQSWYAFLPWEDWRRGRPSLIDGFVLPALQEWADSDSQRRDRVALTFGEADTGWDPERVLERYELLYEAGLVFEAHRDFHRRHMHPDEDAKIWDEARIDSLTGIAEQLGQPMAHDHRRILATAMGRLRGKLKYRPVVFELLPDQFTLLQLQRVVECLSGVPVHKQNFRRLVHNTGLVEPTGEQVPLTRGRPAALFRFRREVLRERPSPGVGLPSSRIPE